MRTLRLYAMRTLGMLASSFLVSFGTSLFVAVSSFLFARSLARSEGASASIAVLWSVASSFTMPCLAALATMRLVAEDRQTGRMDMVLSAPVCEREYLLGRFFGALIYLFLVLLAYLAVPLLLLPLFASGPSVESLSVAELLPACTGLLMQTAFACAVGVLASACIAQPAVAGAAAVVFAVLLPRAVYQAMFAWSPLVRSRFPVFPFEAHLADTASGLFAFSAAAFFVLFTAWALFAAVKAVAAARLAGRGRFVLKFSTAFVVALGLVFAAMAFLCAVRLDFTVEWPFRGRSPGFSARTRSIRADTHGETRATCFLSRSDPAWRGIVRLLRGLEAAAKDAAGTRLFVDFVDPRWDLSTAVRLTRLGVNATIRRTLGADINASCGQLRRSLS
ncbi:MAG: ABC transporter permease subunit [Pyramidobacter sp.]|nr:ABC transporter permease subunit [Pyramidobacter sp.]